MKISRDDLKWAASEALLSGEQEEALWGALSRRTAGRQKFDFAHVAYYFGALLVISAMAWFMTSAWDEIGGAGIAAIAMIYAICFTLAGRKLWDGFGLRVPGGLLFTLAVWMTPLVVYGIERVAGIWPQDDPGSYRDYHIWVKGSWLIMELATIAAGAIALRFRKFPFLTFPIAFTLWYMSMDLTPLVFGKDDFTWEERQWVSVCFGLAVILVAYLVDLRGWVEDYAFWGYLFGLLAFWGGLSFMDSDSEISKFIYFLINMGLIGVSLFLRRRSFLVFGVLGVFGYLGHLAWRVFEDSLMFPFVLTLGGLAVIWLGVVFQRKREAIDQWFQSHIPAEL